MDQPGANIARDAPLHYRMLQRLLCSLVRWLTHLDVQGLPNVPASGPLIVSPNHLHLFDSVIAFALVPRHMTAFAADKWRPTPFGCLLSWFGNAIYVARGEPDRTALAHALAVLRSGCALGVAPEGTRSKTGGLQRGKDGAAYLASRSGAPILPLVMWGQEQTFRCWLRLRRPAIHVRFAAPIALPPGAARARTAELSAYTDDLMRELARLLPAQYRGVYADRV